ncbi:MAG TPA: protein kinase, partial [Aggregicoccus sp.]|nr:protein kinase [Aggregicoccus sp.]
NIAQVYDMGEAEGTYFMALEYVAGVDLAQVLEQARQTKTQLPVPVVLYLGQRMMEGLGYAHRKAGPDGLPLGIVHRDISPHNVMVSYEGEVKVIDFGLAKSAARSKYTMPSTVMGKLGYMSPEQARAEALDHRSDIYSAGVVLWELLAGRQLVPYGTTGEMVAAMANPRIPSLCELRPDVSPELDATLRRALATAPGERYARADDLARALATHFVQSGAQLGAEEVGNYVRNLCPEAFAAQRRLLSKLSTSTGYHRSPQPPAASPAPIPLTTPAPGAQDPGLEATLLRRASFRDLVPGESAAAATAAAPYPVMAPAAPPQRKRRALPIALLVLAVFGLTVAGLYLWERRASRTPVVAGPARTVVDPATPPELADKAAAPVPSGVVTVTPAPVKPEEPAAAPGEPAAPTAEKAGEPAAPTAEKAGEPEQSAAAPGEPTEPPAAGVAEKPAPAGAAAAPTEPKVAEATPTPAPGKAAPAPSEPVKPAAPKRRAKPRPGDTGSTQLASSTTPPKPAPTAPAPSAPVAAAPEATPPPPVAAPQPRRLQGRAKLEGTFTKSVAIFNTDRETWSECAVIVEGNRVVRVAVIGQGMKNSFPLKEFRADGSVRPAPARTVAVQCVEGRGEFPLK